MSKIVDAGKQLEGRHVKSNDREPLNWLSKLLYFENDFFLAAASLLILENYSKGILRLLYVLLFL